MAEITISSTFLNQVFQQVNHASASIVYLSIWNESFGISRPSTFQSHQTLSDSTGLSKSTVQKAIKYLVEIGYLRCNRRNSTATPEYQVLYPLPEQRIETLPTRRQRLSASFSEPTLHDAMQPKTITPPIPISSRTAPNTDPAPTQSTEIPSQPHASEPSTHKVSTKNSTLATQSDKATSTQADDAPVVVGPAVSSHRPIDRLHSRAMYNRRRNRVRRKSRRS